jgi:hypothetical protein
MICDLRYIIRNVKIALMPLTVQHNYRFDAQGKLDADDWLLIPRSELHSAFALTDNFAQEMAQLYFDTAAQTGILPVKILHNGQTVELQTLLGKTAMLFAEQERIVDAQRAETSWRIAGGFLLAHRVNYGGRFYIGAEWQPDALKLYSTIRRFPPRLLGYFGNTRGVSIYHQTQGRLHKQIQEKFLQRASTRVLNSNV